VLGVTEEAVKKTPLLSLGVIDEVFNLFKGNIHRFQWCFEARDSFNTTALIWLERQKGLVPYMAFP